MELSPTMSVLEYWVIIRFTPRAGGMFTLRYKNCPQCGPKITPPFRPVSVDILPSTSEPQRNRQLGNPTSSTPPQHEITEISILNHNSNSNLNLNAEQFQFATESRVRPFQRTPSMYPTRGRPMRVHLYLPLRPTTSETHVTPSHGTPSRPHQYPTIPHLMV